MLRPLRAAPPPNRSLRSPPVAQGAVPRRVARAALGWIVTLGLAFSSAPEAAADPYRLRGDVYAFGAAPTPAGLITLSGQARPSDWASAEAAVWMGTGAGQGTDEVSGDVLVANILLREPHGYGDLRLGRMLVTAGAIRPLQLDGASFTGRVPRGPQIQVFGGAPVTPAFGTKAFDWAAGGRLSQRFGEVGALGVSYIQRRGEGQMAQEELGFDASLSPARWLDAATDVAVDMLHQAVTSARASVAFRSGRLRFELFALRRSPAYLLPATSLFAALGNVPSDQGGGQFWVRAAPRLDVWTSGSFDSIAGEPGGRASLHTVLRLDDRGDGAVWLEATRRWAPDASWTGARGMLRLPLAYRLTASAEVEVAFPDEPEGRGEIWPWALVAVSYSPSFARWLDVAAGAEAGATPMNAAYVSALVRASATWERGSLAARSAPPGSPSGGNSPPSNSNAGVQRSLAGSAIPPDPKASGGSR